MAGVRFSGMGFSGAATTFAREVRPEEDRALLNEAEFGRLVYLLALLNDTSVTQLDTDESQDLSRLLYKIQNDGDDRPLAITDDRIYDAVPEADRWQSE